MIAGWCGAARPIAPGLAGAVALILAVLARPAPAMPADGPMDRLEPAPTGQALPTAPLLGPDGRVATLSDLLDGRFLVVNFWATWCAPCIAELPALDRLQRRAATRLRVIAVSVDRGAGAPIAAFLDRLGVTALPLYRDPASQLARAFGVASFPATVLIDPAGAPLGHWSGFVDWDALEPTALDSP